MGFEPLVNQRLLPSTFPRYTKIKGRIDSLDYLDGVISRIRAACKITQVQGLHAALVSPPPAWKLRHSLRVLKITRFTPHNQSWE